MALSLQELRLNAGLSTRELGDAVGISHVTVANAEKSGRRPQPQTAKKLADYFDVQVIDLWPVEERSAA